MQLNAIRVPASRKTFKQFHNNLFGLIVKSYKRGWSYKQ